MWLRGFCCVLTRSPDGRYIASVSFDATTVIWEKQGNSYEVVSSLEGHESEVKSVAWSPSGSYIATCSRDKSVWIWEADPDTDFECISVLHGHTQDVKFVKWHPTEDLLVSVSYDDTVRIWAENEGAILSKSGYMGVCYCVVWKADKGLFITVCVC